MGALPAGSAGDGRRPGQLWPGRSEDDGRPLTVYQKEELSALLRSRDEEGGTAVAKMLDMIEKTVRGEIPPPPVARLIGFQITSIDRGEAVVEFVATEAHANPMGTLHGGVLCDIADAAMGLAYAATLGEGESFTTLELKINFLKPVWKDKLRAVARVVKGGRTIGLVECDITDSQESLIARSTSTCMTLRKEQASGR